MTNYNDYMHLIFDDAADSTETTTATDNNDKDAKQDTAKPPKSDKSADKSDKDEKKYSDADIDKIIEKKFAKWQKQKDAEIDEAKKLADMTATERAEHERDKLKAELDQLKHANTVAEMERTARGILHENGINVSDDIVSRLVADDAETTSEIVKSFTKAFKAAVLAEVKSQLAHKSPTTGGGGGITRDMINKETDPIKRQAMIRENMSLYNTRRK